ncbi:MAG: glycerol dehydrogenase [Clostridiales bacterium]|nr:glycerol dehydrogenase [Clostridiales bacterium]
MMYRSMVSPSKYYQGYHLLDQLIDHISFAGTRFAVIIDPAVKSIVLGRLDRAFRAQAGGFQYQLIDFNGESTLSEAERVRKLVESYDFDGVIGIGGGKLIDTSKYVANASRKALVIIPTSASSDAPCSGISVVYDDHGVFLKAERMNRNPDLVLVDTSIIFSAPKRLLVAGVGDAIATFYEARACSKSKALNYTGGKQPEVAVAIARLCRDILFENIEEAIESMDEGVASEAFERVVEANIFLSGVGFENNGCALAHATYNGLTEAVPGLAIMHGEGVAFGTILQLVTEFFVNDQWDLEEFRKIVEIYKKIGLPTTLKGLKIDADEQTINRIAIEIAKTKNASHMPFEVTADLLRTTLKLTEDLFDDENRLIINVAMRQ